MLAAFSLTFPPVGFFAMPEILTPAEAGRLIRRRREEKGLTQEQVAENLQIKNPNYVSYLESGKTNVARSKYLGALAKFIGLTPEEVRSINPNVLFESVTSLGDYVQVRIKIQLSGIPNGMKSHNSYQTSVSRELGQRVLGGLVMDKSYVHEIPAGFYALWSDREAAPGELVVVEKNGAQYPAFLLANGMVQVDTVIDDDTALRFKPDAIIGAIEEIRLLELPKRTLT